MRIILLNCRSCRQLGFCIDVFFVGHPQGDLDDTYWLYKSNFKAALNLKNVLDDKNFEVSSGQTAIAPIAPFTV